MVDRIDSIQAAPCHSPGVFMAFAIIPHSHRRSSAQNAESGGDRKRDESLLSVHGRFRLEPVPAIAGQRTTCGNKSEAERLNFTKMYSFQTGHCGTADLLSFAQDSETVKAAAA